MKVICKIALGLSLVATLHSCGLGGSAPKTLYNWHGYESARYAVASNPTEKSVQELIDTYEKLINKQGKGLRKAPPPGVCAEYGYLLIKKGERSRGLELLKREIDLYPESKVFIQRIIKQYE